VIQNIMRIITYIVLLLLLGCVSQSRLDIAILDLSNHGLSVVPDSVFSITNLKYLNLGNSFTLYPPLSSLHDEEQKTDRINKITQIPEDIVNWPNLKVLNLCSNDLTSLPLGVTKLEQLDTLNLAFNKRLLLARELNILSKMHWLKYLDITGINSSQSSINELRKSLPKTKVVATVEELFKDAIPGDTIYNFVKP
jgi:Leucine-rich repeat (LRR) protein